MSIESAEGFDPTAPTPVAVHGTEAWVVIARDHPLASMVLTYADANKLQAELRKVLADKGITLRDAF